MRFNEMMRELPVTYEAGSTAAAGVDLIRSWRVRSRSSRADSPPSGDGDRTMFDNTLMNWCVESLHVIGGQHRPQGR
jgi:hypothetical protein